RLKEIATSQPGQAEWKGLVERLSDTTPDRERLQVYRAVQKAGVLPEDAGWFLLAHAIQWIPLPGPPEGEPEDEEELDEAAAERALDEDTRALFRHYGAEDLLELYDRDRR